MPPPERILVVRTDRIGDVVLTIPALRALKKGFPAAHLAVLLNAATRPLVEGLPFVDSVLSEQAPGSLYGFLRTLGRLRRERFDLAVIFHTKRRTQLLCALAGIPVRLGYRDGKWGGLLTSPAPDSRVSSGRHEIDNCLHLVASLGIAGDDPSLDLPRDPDAETWADTFVSRLAPDRPLICLHPDASCATKRWPPGHFARLARDLNTRYDARLAVIGGPTARPMADDIARNAGPFVYPLAGTMSLARTVAFLRRVRLLVSNDSGPVHLAAAVGTPVISLFLRTQPGLGPERWAPRSARSAFLANPEADAVLIGPDSRPFSGKADAIKVDEVLAAVTRLGIF